MPKPQHVAALAVALLWAEPCAAAEEKIADFTLKNGLEVIVIPNHRVPAVSHMLWYRIGASDDPSGKSGLAHFHEHLMYKGTQHYKSGEYSEIIARHGGQQNAFTGHDATSYYIDISKDQLPLAMQLEADRMRPLTVSDEEAVKEKQVIIEERRLRIENNPTALLSEQMDAALFRNHPYHWPVIGWMEEMEGLSKADVLKFHQTYYHPNNAILIVSGDVTASEMKALAEKYYGPLPSAPLPKRHWNDEPPHIAAVTLALTHQNVREPGWYRDYAAPSLAYGNKAQALPLFVLAQVLGGGKTGRLYRALVEEQKLASSVDASYDGFNLGPAEFSLSVTPLPGVAMEKIASAVEAEIARLEKDGMSDAELARAKTQLKAESIYARDGLSSMARVMGWIRIAGLNSDYFEQWPQRIDRITAEQVLAAAKDSLQPERSVTGLLLPKMPAKDGV